MTEGGEQLASLSKWCNGLHSGRQRVESGDACHTGKVTGGVKVRQASSNGGGGDKTSLLLGDSSQTPGSLRWPRRLPMMSGAARAIPGGKRSQVEAIAPGSARCRSTR